MKTMINLVFFAATVALCFNAWAAEKMQEPKVEKWILEVKSKCRDMVDGYQFEDDDAFNDWYNNVHIPDIMKAMPEFKSARRFMNPDFSTLETGKYLALYEIETDDINKTMGRLLEAVRKIEKQGRMSPLLQTVSMTVYKEISSRVQDE